MLKFDLIIELRFITHGDFDILFQNQILFPKHRIAAHFSFITLLVGGKI